MLSSFSSARPFSRLEPNSVEYDKRDENYYFIIQSISIYYDSINNHIKLDRIYLINDYPPFHFDWLTLTIAWQFAFLLRIFGNFLEVGVSLFIVMFFLFFIFVRRNEKNGKFQQQAKQYGLIYRGRQTDDGRW